MPELELQITDIARDLLFTVMLVSGPILLVGLLAGLGVSLFQALTSVQEQTMSLIPKMFAVMLVTLLMLAPFLQVVRNYTQNIFERLNSFGLS